MTEHTLRRGARTRVQLSLVEATDPEDFLQAAVTHVAGVIGVVGSYSISTVLHEHALTVASSDLVTWDADQVGFDTRAGPGLDALRDGLTRTVHDLRVEHRWPVWSAFAATAGFRSAAAVPVEVDGQPHHITLNLYSGVPAAFTAGPLALAELFLTEIAHAMPSALQVFDPTGTVQDLQTAIASRSTLDQTLKVLMTQGVQPRRGVRRPPTHLPRPQPEAARRGRDHPHPPHLIHRPPSAATGDPRPVLPPGPTLRGPHRVGLRLSSAGGCLRYRWRLVVGQRC